MGSCFSHERQTGDGAATEDNNAARPSSRANLTESGAARARSSSDARLNAALRVPTPVKHSPPQLALSPWTPSELARQRDAFFETRVSGRSEVWAVLKEVCEMLRQGRMEEAQAAFDAAGVTCPSGKVAVERKRGGVKKGGVFDSKGLLYEIPGWVVADPQDLVQDVPVAEKETEDEDDEDVDEKGGETVTVRARLSDSGTDVVVQVGVDQKVGVLVRKVREKAGVDQKVRLAYMGKILDEHKSLDASGWKEGHILNALVFE